MNKGELTYIFNGHFSSYLVGDSLREGNIYSPKDYMKLLVLAQDKNTYIETVSGNGLPSADMFHINIKEGTSLGTLRDSTRKRAIKQIGNRNQKVIAIFDETHEPYYGFEKNEWIHEYKPQKGCTGSYRFLSCQILMSDGTKIFVDCVPMNVFSKTESVVGDILRLLIASRVKILFTLFDRGYYSNAVINEIERYRIKYLMLVPKTRGIKGILEKDQRVMFVEKGYMVAGKARTDIIIIRDENFIWTFATNLNFKKLPNAIRTYKMRWNIETGFRVCDEARIKSKSTNIKVRYFLFLCSFIMYNFWKTQKINPEITFKRMMGLFSEDIIGEKYFWKGYMYALKAITCNTSP